MSEHPWKRQVVFAGIAAVAAAIGGTWLTLADQLPETTLDKLFDACAGFAETGEMDGLAALGVPVRKTGRVEMQFAVEGGTVSVELVELLDEGRKNQCEVRGSRRGAPDAYTNPGLTWRAAKARTDAWFAQRAQQPGIVRLKVIAVPENHSLVACPKKDKGYSIGGGTMALSLTPPVAFADQPFRFHAGRSKQQSNMACRMVGLAKGG